MLFSFFTPHWEPLCLLKFKIEKTKKHKTNKDNTHSSKNDWTKWTGWFASSLRHCYNYSYSQGHALFQTHYSQGAEKSKNQSFIIGLWFVEHNRLFYGYIQKTIGKQSFYKCRLRCAPPDTWKKRHCLHEAKKMAGLSVGISRNFNHLPN